MKNLYIDFDGVIMDTISIIYGEFEEHGISNASEKIKHQYIANMDWIKLLENAHELANSFANIRKLENSGKFNISIMSHVCSINEAIEKIKVISSKLPDITIIIVPIEITKTKMVHTKDAILVDDFKGNLIEWEKEGGIGVKYSSNNKESTFKTITSLDQLIDLF